MAADGLRISSRTVLRNLRRLGRKDDAQSTVCPIWPISQRCGISRIVLLEMDLAVGTNSTRVDPKAIWRHSKHCDPRCGVVRFNVRVAGDCPMVARLRFSHGEVSRSITIGR